MTTKPMRRTCSNTFSSIMLVTKLRGKLSLRLTLKRTVKEFSHKKNYYQQNKEKIKAARKIYYASHRVEELASNRARRLKNARKL